MKNFLLAISVIITIYLMHIIGNDIDNQLANDVNQTPITLTK